MAFVAEPHLLRAAASCDLTFVERALSTPRGREAAGRVRGREGHTLAHVLLHALRFEAGSDVASLVAWPDPNRTLFRHDVVAGLSHAVRPLLHAALQLHPHLAHAATERGLTPAHVAAEVGSLPLLEDVLRAAAASAANASHTAANATARDAVPSWLLRPLDVAAGTGNWKTVHALLRAIPDDAERKAERARIERAAQLAGHPLARTTPAGQASSAPRQEAARRPTQPRVDPPPAEPAGDAAGCAEGGGWDVPPPPSEAARRRECDIDQRVGLSAEEWYRDYYLAGRPVLVRGAMPLRSMLKGPRVGAAGLAKAGLMP